MPLASEHRQLVLRVPDALLELPAVCFRLAPLDALQLRLRRLELLAGAGVVDLARLDGVVDERERAVLLDLEEAGTGRELEHVLARAVAVDARRARVQQRDERRMSCEHAEFAVRARDDEHLDVALEGSAFGRDEGNAERRGQGQTAAGSAAGSGSGASSVSSGCSSGSSPSPESCRAFATAWSIVPTM